MTEVSIKHLLGHTAGLAYWFNSAQLYRLGNKKIIKNRGSIYFTMIRGHFGHMEIQLHF